MSPSRFMVAPALLGGISVLTPGEKSSLSPLRIPNPTELTPDQQTLLKSIGLLGATGLSEDGRLLLGALSEATAFARLRVSTSTGFLDEAVYFNGESSQTVNISNTPEGLTLIYPGDIDAVLARVSEFTGTSSRPACPWSVELPPLEGLVLAGLLDMRRKAVIRALIDNQAVNPPPSDSQSVSAAINGLLGNAQWFAATVQNVCGLTGAPAPVQVQAALASLDGKHWVWQQAGNYFPLTEALQAADRFLLTGSLLSLDLGHANSQGRAAFSRVAWLQSSVSEMFQIAQTVNQVRLETVTPAAALEKIRYYLTQAEALPVPPLDQVELAVAIQAGLGAGQIFPLGEETVMGRSEQANIRILDAGASRRHSVIRRLDQGYQVTDAGSTNGTYLNGQLLTIPIWLKAGDVISIGETRILVIRAGSTPPAPVGEPIIFANEDSNPIPLEPPEQPGPVPAPFVAEIFDPPVSVEPVSVPVPVPSVPPVEPEEPEPAKDQCPRCSSAITPGARFCGNCGFRLID